MKYTAVPRLLILGCLLLATAGNPSIASALPTQGTIPADQAGAAISATLAQASRTGMTFTSRGSRTFQRNADGTVVAELEEGKLRFLTLFRGSKALPLAPMDWMTPKEQSMIPRQLSAAYGIGKDPWGNFFGETDEPDLLNPFLGYAQVPTAVVEVDAQGRAVKLMIDGETEVEVLAWKAPLAVAPAADRLLDADKLGTAQNLAVSANWFYGAVYEFARRIGGVPGYQSAPLPTLRRMIKTKGWPAVNTGKGVSITLTDGLGATWKTELIAERKSVRMKGFQLLGYPPIMNAEVANARLRLGIDALASAELIACPRDCVVYDKAVPLTFENAQDRLVAGARRDDVTGLTSGPDFPGTSSEKISIGIEGTAADFVARYSVEEADNCVSIAIRGPGSPVMPTSYEAKPGSVGPYGTCVP
jgi:hypothetical protein